MSNDPNVKISGTNWEDWADKSIVIDSENGKASKQKEKAKDESNESPASNWPY